MSVGEEAKHQPTSGQNSLQSEGGEKMGDNKVMKRVIQINFKQCESISPL